MTASNRLGLASFMLATCALAACSSESAPPPTIIESNDASSAGDAAIETPDAADGGCDGAKCVGEPCTKNGECVTGACFIGGSRNFCTKQCSGPSDCPMPPYANVCNNQGYCRL